MYQRFLRNIQQQKIPPPAAPGTSGFACAVAASWISPFKTWVGENAVTRRGQRPPRGFWSLKRDGLRSDRRRALDYWLSMIFSENRFSLFRIML
jgi:hypothetical protein